MDWLAAATDPYDAQDRLAARIAEVGADAVAIELLAALDDPATPTRVSEGALGVAASLAEDASAHLAAELVASLGPYEGEPADATFAALARAMVRAPEHPGLVDAVRAAARRAVQPAYDARHGREQLQRAVSEGRAPRALLARFEDAVANPGAAADPVWDRMGQVSEAGELEGLLAEVGAEALAQRVVERHRELSADAPDGRRIGRLAEELRDRLPPSSLRGQLALAQAWLMLGDFQIAFGCLVAALADRPSDREALSLVTEGVTEAPDVVDDDTVELLVRTHGLAPATAKRLRAAIAKGRKAAGA